MQGHIGVDEEQHLAAGQRGQAMAGVGFAHPPGRQGDASHHADPIIGCGQARHDGVGAIGRPVVVNDDLQRIGGAGQCGHHRGLDTAGLIGEQPIALPALRQAHDRCGHHPFEREGGCLPRRFWAQDHLTHVAHVKKPGCGAGLGVFSHYPFWILNWHLVACERHHLRPAAFMQIMQRCP